MTFIQKVIKGQAKSEDVDRYISKWQCDMNTALMLSEYLGMTHEEYIQWVERPETLQAIIENHRRLD